MTNKSYIVRVGTEGDYRWLDQHYSPSVHQKKNAHKWHYKRDAAKEADMWTNGTVEIVQA